MSTPIPKSAAKKEAKRLEKEAKFAAKASKQAPTPSNEKKQKLDKEKKENDPPFVNTTPKGEKKGMHAMFNVEQL
jgi:valyl-tRNA synthetase